MFCCIDTFFSGFMCKGLVSGAIAYSINAGNISKLICINNYFSFISFYTKLFKTDVLYIRNNSYSTQKYICIKGNLAIFCFYFRAHTITFTFNTYHFTIGHYVNSLLLKKLFEFF